jgi:hypothetical protein
MGFLELLLAIKARTRLATSKNSYANLLGSSRG